MSHKDIRKKTLEKANRIVVKVGSSIWPRPRRLVDEQLRFWKWTNPHVKISNVKIQMSNQCQNSKLDSETSSECHTCHAELDSASRLSFGFDLNFELCHLTFSSRILRNDDQRE
jgi:hypothetical protein